MEFILDNRVVFSECELNIIRKVIEFCNRIKQVIIYRAIFVFIPLCLKVKIYSEVVSSNSNQTGIDYNKQAKYHNKRYTILKSTNNSILPYINKK